MSKQQRGLYFATTAIGIAVALSVAACGSASGEPATPSPSPSVPAAAPNSGVSNGQTYTVTPSSSTGATPDGHGTWTLKVDTISGGDPKVADAFNNAVQASARGQREQFDGAQPNPDPTRPWNFGTTPQTYFSSASVSELLGGVYYAQNAAHPIDTVSTVVIDSRSATPITLKDLFTNEQAGLDRLSQQTKQLLPAVLGTGAAPMADEPGNASVEANFANWIPTPQGIQVSFNDGQFSKYAPPHSVPPVTIPWSAIDDLLAPGMTALRQPG